MAGVMNNTARQYNIKAKVKDGPNVAVRLHPGFNVVKDEHWTPVSKLKYTKALKTDGKIDFGSTLNRKAEKSEDKSETSKSKATKAPSAKKD